MPPGMPGGGYPARAGEGLRIILCPGMIQNRCLANLFAGPLPELWLDYWIG